MQFFIDPSKTKYTLKFLPNGGEYDDEYYHCSLIITRLAIAIVLQLNPLIDARIEIQKNFTLLIGSIKRA